MLRFMSHVVTSTKSFLKGVDTWKKETIAKRVIDGPPAPVPCSSFDFISNI